MTRRFQYIGFQRGGMMKVIAETILSSSCGLAVEDHHEILFLKIGRRLGCGCFGLIFLLSMPGAGLGAERGKSVAYTAEGQTRARQNAVAFQELTNDLRARNVSPEERIRVMAEWLQVNRPELYETPKVQSAGPALARRPVREPVFSSDTSEEKKTLLTFQHDITVAMAGINARQLSPVYRIATVAKFLEDNHEGFEEAAELRAVVFQQEQQTRKARGPTVVEAATEEEAALLRREDAILDEIDHWRTSLKELPPAERIAATDRKLEALGKYQGELRGITERLRQIRASSRSSSILNPPNK